MSRSSRRSFLQSTAGLAAAGFSAPYFINNRVLADSKNDRPRIGSIGTGDRWRAVGNLAMNFGDIVAVCDVDRNHMEQGQEIVNKKLGKKPVAFEDYRKILDDKSIDIVTVVTTDHWHVKIAIEALKAGKDVYCEKPLTLTIDEGKKICKVLKETGRIFQVGTQQRSEMGGPIGNKELGLKSPARFLTAVAMVRDGRIGKVQHVTACIGSAPTSGKLPKVAVPNGLNWERWLGQAPLAEYVSGSKPEKGYPQSRCHYEFRWWYEYSGGKMTDWGAHHVDISHWGIGADNTGPISVEGTAKHPQELKNGMPTEPDRYNVASEFHVKCKFESGVLLEIRNDGKNGVTFTGDKGEIFVSRGELTGKPVDELKDKPLPEALITKLYKGKTPGNHMGNFIECCRDRKEPVSDVYSHHRAMTTCHLANIAIRLGRKLAWDPVKEQITGDSEANGWLAREQRKGYEITT